MSSVRGVLSALALLRHGSNFSHCVHFETPKPEGSGGGGGSGGGNNPPDPQKLVNEQIKAVIGDMFKPIQQNIADMPGMVKRVAAETVEELLKKKLPQPDPEEEKKKKEAEEKAKTDKERLVAVEGELKSFKDQVATEKRANAILNSIGDINILKSARSWVIQDIASQVKTRDDGSYYMIVKTKLESTGAEVTKEVDLNEGIQNYFESRPDLVIKKVTGGAGATGGNKPTGVQGEVTYERLLADSALMTDYLTKPELRPEFERLKKEHEAKKTKK